MVISRSRRPRLIMITLTETLIILDITKTSSNNCFITHLTKAANASVTFGKFSNDNDETLYYHYEPYRELFQVNKSLIPYL